MEKKPASFKKGSPMGESSTEDLLKEINKKLDAIMRALAIGPTPERNQRELKQLAAIAVEKIRQKEQNDRSAKKRTGY